MEEMLEVYDLKGNLIGVKERGKYYAEIRKEFKKTGKVTEQVKSIRLLLMNSNGRIYIQRRSDEKGENPGLYDKTIGGHVVAGHTWYVTVVQECHQELGFPAVVLTDEEFKSAIKVTDLRIIGMFRKVDQVSNFLSIRKSKDGEFRQPFITSFYIGYYDGSIRFCDGESTGIEVFTLPQLEKKIKEKPELFTEDLKYMIKKYKNYLVPISKLKQNKEVIGFEE